MPPKQMSNSPFLTQEDLTAVNYIAGQTINLLMRRRGGDRDRATVGKSDIFNLFISFYVYFVYRKSWIYSIMLLIVEIENLGLPCNSRSQVVRNC